MTNFSILRDIIENEDLMDFISKMNSKHEETLVKNSPDNVKMVIVILQQSSAARPEQMGRSLPPPLPRNPFQT